MEVLENLFTVAESEFGISNYHQIESLSKALLAPSSPDDLYATAGGVLTHQSLEGVLTDLTLNMNDFPFWQDISKTKAYSTVEEYNQKIGQGISDGGFVGAMENPEFRNPDFQKQIAIVKFLSEGWNVSDVASATNTMVNLKAQEQRSAMIRLLRNLSLAFYEGNSEWIPDSIDGISKIIAGESSNQTFDLRGGNLTMGTFNTAAKLVIDGNGVVDNTRLYSSPAALQNLQNIVENTTEGPLNRKNIQIGDPNVTIGNQIKAIQTAFGTVIPRMDKLLGLAYESHSVPVYRNTDVNPSVLVEGATSDKAPTVPSVALTVQAAPIANSQFTATTGVRPAGVAYRYRVSARNKYGRSIASAIVTAGSPVAVNGAIQLTITPSQLDSGSKLATCFVIYSEKAVGSGKFRYLTTVAANPSNPLAAVTYQDKNDYIPETARMFMVDQTAVGEQRTIGFSQLLPIHNTNLDRVGRFEHGLINLYGVLKFYRPNILIEIRNIGVEQVNVNHYNIL